MKKHFSNIPLSKPSMPCGNSVIKNNIKTATNNIVVRSVRLWHFDGLLKYHMKYRNTKNKQFTFNAIKVKQFIGFIWKWFYERKKQQFFCQKYKNQLNRCVFLFFFSLFLNKFNEYIENYLWPFKTVLTFDALAVWLYPLSLTLRLAAWHSTRISMKLITVKTKQGNNFIITECIQKLKLFLLLNNMYVGHRIKRATKQKPETERKKMME